MRNLPIAAVAAIALGVALAAAAAAQTSPTHHKKTVGYLDENGTFHTFARPDPDLIANSTHTGKYVVNFHVKIDTAIPSGSTIYCSADIEVLSEQTLTVAPYDIGIIYEESGTGSVAAGAVGSTVVCPVVINYSWSFPAASTSSTDKVVNTVSGDYTVGAVKVPTGSSSVLTLDASRESTSDLPVASAPLSTGGTATITVAVTL